MVTKKPKGLGRGLEALLGPKVAETPQGETQPANPGQPASLRLDDMVPGQYQPRTRMDEGALYELAESIKAQGIMSPILVRRLTHGDHAGRYEIIAGERRFRAARLAGLDTVPVLVREVPDEAAAAMALIENIQREDLNPLEEATALSRLIREFELTHQQAAEAVGRSRAAVSNLLRLLDLPEAVRTLLEKHRLEMGHARALITLEPARATALALAAADGGWSVRELEERVRNEQAAKTAGKPDGKKKPGTDPNITRLEQDLSEKLATRVSIQHARNGRGKLVIAYHSIDELDGILERIR